jgi:hypothetical protein
MLLLDMSKLVKVNTILAKASFDCRNPMCGNLRKSACFIILEEINMVSPRFMIDTYNKTPWMLQISNLWLPNYGSMYLPTPSLSTG